MDSPQQRSTFGLPRLMRKQVRSTPLILRSEFFESYHMENRKIHLEFLESKLHSFHRFAGSMNDRQRLDV
jgi:hypothetical protein